MMDLGCFLETKWLKAQGQYRLCVHSPGSLFYDLLVPPLNRALPLIEVDLAVHGTDM